jgi:hypothetical protein
VVNNRNQFLINSEIHGTNTRHSSYLHVPLENLDICQREYYYSDIKILNGLPFNIKKISDNPRKFESVLKKIICELL